MKLKSSVISFIELLTKVLFDLWGVEEVGLLLLS
jgi:hypothetical protein